MSADSSNPDGKVAAPVCDWLYGASAFPKLLARLKEIGRAIVNGSAARRHFTDDETETAALTLDPSVIITSGDTATVGCTPSQGFDCSYAAFRIPALVNAGGVLIAFAEGRRFSCSGTSLPFSNDAAFDLA